jgi:ABC-type antimicrobial peptide transport system permease subunit
MIVVLICAIILSIFYANLIVTYRRLEIATLKCIGWRNNHVRTLIVGEIFAVTLVSFIIVIEFFFHWIAIASYIFPKKLASAITPIQWIPLLITFGVILGVQVVAILIANDRILKVRPIQALQMQR